MTVPVSVDHLREVRVSRKTLHQGLRSMYIDTVKLPSGREGQREVVEHPGSIAVVTQKEDGGIVMVRQWRYAADRALWELPAGTRNAGEDPDLTAKRELSEETGFTARTWRSLGSFLLAPGYSSELMHLYLATDLAEGDTHPDEDELLDVSTLNPQEMQKLIAAGDVDMKTIAALALSGVRVDG